MSYALHYHDGSIWQDITSKLVSSTLIDKKGKGIDTYDMVLHRDQDSTVTIGVKIRFTVNSVVRFIGRVQSRTLKYLLNAECKSLSYDLQKREGAEVYENKTTSFMVSDLIDKYTDFSTASILTTTTTFSEPFIVNYETLDEKIKLLADTDAYVYYVDNSEVFHYEPETYTQSGITLTVGTNCWHVSDDTKTSDELVNNLTVIGGKQTFNKQDKQNGDASTSIFTLTEKPFGNVRVVVDDVEQTPGREGSVSAYDFTVVYENKQVIFESGSIPGSGTNNVVMDYAYDLPLIVTGSDPNSVSTYTQFDGSFNRDDIGDIDTLINYYQQRLSKLNEPKAVHTVQTINQDVQAGQVLTLVDSVNDINAQFLVRKVIFKFPQMTSKVFLNDLPETVPDAMDNFDERIRQLEKKLSTTSLVNKVFSQNEEVTVEDEQLIIEEQGFGTSFILGSSINGLLGSASCLLGDHMASYVEVVNDS